MTEYSAGTVKISEDVVIKIIETAACEVEGVSGICPKTGKAPKIAGVVLVKEDDGSLSVNVRIAVAENFKIIDVSEKVQTHVAESVNTMTGITVRRVNVTVAAVGDVR